MPTRSRPGQAALSNSARLVYFITHPEVVVDPAIPVPRWPLSARGRTRMEQIAQHAWASQLVALFCSEEQKAIDGATILSRIADVPWQARADLGENDRSATGFLPKAEFEATADVFFARPTESVRGWERAVDAQARIVRAVEEIARSSQGGDGPIAIVAHGGVGALLLSHLKRQAISRTDDQPGSSGGNYFVFRMPGFDLQHGWRSIEP